MAWNYKLANGSWVHDGLPNESLPNGSLVLENLVNNIPDK